MSPSTFGFGVALFVAVVEVVMFLAAPALLARLAVMPVGLSRTVQLSNAAGRRITVAAPGGTGYREPPKWTMSLARLRAALGGSGWAFEGAALRLDREGRLAMRCYDGARGRRMRRPWMVARFAARLHDGTLTLRPRCLPAPFFGLLGVLVALGATPPFELRSVVASVVIFVVLVAVNLLANRWLVRAALDFLEDELRAERDAI